MINKLDSSDLSFAFKELNEFRQSLLSVCAAKKSEAVFLALLNKIKPEIFNSYSARQSKDYNTIFTTTAAFQSETSFQALIQKANETIINLVLAEKNDREENLLYLAATKQSDAAFLALLNKVNAKTLKQAFDIESLMSLSQKESFNALKLKLLMEKINQKDCRQLFAKVKAEKPFLAKKIAALVFDPSISKDENFLAKLSFISFPLRNEIAIEITEHFQQQKTWPEDKLSQQFLQKMLLSAPPHKKPLHHSLPYLLHKAALIFSFLSNV